MSVRWVIVLVMVAASAVAAGGRATDAAAAPGTPELPQRHHPVDVAVPEEMALPEGWVLSENRHLACASCHGLDGIEQPDTWAGIDKADPSFLHDGPYRRLEKFCFHCHDDSRFRRWNPHRQRLESGTLDQTTCNYCHLEQPQQSPAEASRQTELRLPPAVLCLGCHLRTPHLNSLEHSGAPSEQVLQRLEAHNRSASRPFPLDAHRQITCVTCHDPHQPGVIDKLSADESLWQGESDVETGPVYAVSRWNRVYQADKAHRLADLQQHSDWPMVLSYQRLEREILLRLPAKDGSLCTVCHRFED